MNFGDDEIRADNIFAYFTRTVANVDRHDESSLAERKTPLATFGKKIMKKSLFHPWKWPKITQFICQEIYQTGGVFVEGISPEFFPAPQDFSVIEWNLGGAKASRFLQKKLTLTFRETAPKQWKGIGHFSVRNIGGYDEPLSQTWKGTFEFRFPEVLHAEPAFFSGELAPGEEGFEKEFQFEFQGEFNEISVFQPRGQNMLLDLTVSTFPQQSIFSHTLDVHENVGEFVGKLKPGRNVFPWREESDIQVPFVTFHEVIPFAALSDELKSVFESYASPEDRVLSLAEIHFNELITISPDVQAIITDKDVVNSEIADQPEFKVIEMLPDERSAVVGFWRDGEQTEERFSIQFSGITDRWGNEISDQKYTLMIR